MTYRWTFMTTFKREVQIIHVPVYPQKIKARNLLLRLLAVMFLYFRKDGIILNT